MEAPYNIQEPAKQEEFKVYKRRWYVLVVYSMYSFTQSAVWNTWGPISNTAEDAFGWRNSTIAWMNNWGAVCFVLTGLFFPWLVQVKGLRWATLSSIFCVAAGTAFRIITSEPCKATILIHLGQFLNGVGGPISSGAIPAMSATWFSPSERVTATAVSNSINNFGTAVAFILGPVLVPDTITNRSSPVHKFLLFESEDVESSVEESANITFARRQTERAQIMRYMYYACGWAVLLFLVILCYFPSKPPRPPCMSATMERQHYWTSLLSLKSKPYFLIITVLYGISTGVFGAWTSVLNINLFTVKIPEETSGWIGFYSTVAGSVGGILVGRFASHFVRYIKLIILAMYILTTAALIVFTLMLNNVLPLSVVGLYITVVTANTALNTAVPLMFEMACELAYPTPEGSANGMLTLFSNFWSVVFFAVLSIPNIGTMWMNWTVISSTAICIPLIAVVKERLSRLEIDEDIHPERYAENVIEVPEEYRDDDPLLEHEEVQSEVSGVTVSEHYGFQNPVLTDAVKPRRDAKLDLNIPEAYRNPNPKIIDAAIPQDVNQVSNIPELYCIHNLVSADVAVLSDTDLDLIIPDVYGIQNPIST